MDLGTSSLKCGLFDLAGQRLGSARISYPTNEWVGGAEQHASDWWKALVNAVNLTTKNVSPENIAALSIGGHAPGPVFVDSALAPVCPVLPWCDQRSKEQHERLLLALGRDPDNGSERLMAQIAARAMWMRYAQPDKFAQTKCIMHSSDYLIARLTGRCIFTGSISLGIFNAGDLPLDLLPKIEVEAGELIGGITPDAAGQLGLPVATPVITGGLDSFLASFGSGICEPGDACINTGSSTIVALVTGPNHRARFRLGEYSLMSQPVRLGGRILSWAQKRSDKGVSLPDLLEQAIHLQKPVLNQDILTNFLPAMKVEDHEGGELYSELSRRYSCVEIFRFLLDAILLWQRQTLNELQENNTAVLRVRSVGGLTTHPEFVQLQADVLRKTIEIPRISESGTLGAAMLAAMALGLYDDHKAAISGMSGLSKVYRPQENIAASYDALFQETEFH